MEVCVGAAGEGGRPPPEVLGERAGWRPLQCTCHGGGAVGGGAVEPSLEQPELEEMKSELPVACREAGKVSRELALNLEPK